MSQPTLSVRFAAFVKLAAIVASIGVLIAPLAFLPMRQAIERRHRNRLAIGLLNGLAMGVALIGLLAAGGMALVATLLLALCGWVTAMAWVNLS